MAVIKSGHQNFHFLYYCAGVRPLHCAYIKWSCINPLKSLVSHPWRKRFSALIKSRKKWRVSAPYLRVIKDLKACSLPLDPIARVAEC